MLSERKQENEWHFQAWLSVSEEKCVLTEVRAARCGRAKFGTGWKELAAHPHGLSPSRFEGSCTPASPRGHSSALLGGSKPRDVRWPPGSWSSAVIRFTGKLCGSGTGLLWHRGRSMRLLRALGLVRRCLCCGVTPGCS